MYQPWKFLIYIAADNVLYPQSQVSLREITDSSLFSDVEIIVQLDGPTAAMATRYKCGKGTKRLIWEAPEDYTADRGVRLADFLKAAAGNCHEHERIMLVLWGEGAGLDHIYFYGDTGANGARTTEPGESVKLGSPTKLEKAMRAVRSASNDVLDGENANLYVKDIQLGSILREFSRQIGRRIDILGFDACLMAMAEICYEVRESVCLVVGSDEEVPKQSWPYSLILHDLARFPGMDANTLATLIVSRYVEKYDGPGNSERVSLSAMRLSGSDELRAAMKRLVDALATAAVDVAIKRRIFRARDASRTADETSYIDFGVFCEELMQSFDPGTAVNSCARDVLFILKNHSYILYHRDTGEDGSYDPYGLSICFPQALPPDEAGLAAAEAEFTMTTHVALAVKKDPPHQNKDPQGEMKDPPHQNKDPQGEMKDPPHQNKDPQGGMKDPPHQNKDPQGGMKDPPHQNKDPQGEMKDPPHQNKDPQGEMKDPPHQNKDPGSGRKDPPHQNKFPPDGRSSPMEITSYYILWDSYVPLEFNQQTGWANFLHQVLVDQTDQTGAGA